MMDSNANTSVTLGQTAKKLAVVVIYIRAAASEYETNNAKPVDEYRQLYM